MQKLIIKGRKELSGKISISGSKNASLPILAASILANNVRIKNVPLVKDIFTMIELLHFIGLKINPVLRWSINSGTPLTLAARTGFPRAMLSITTLGMPSCREGIMI